MKIYTTKTIALLLSAIVFVACNSQPSVDSAITDAKEDILISETVNVELILSQNGKAKQIATAPITRQKQTIDKEKYTEFPDGIYIESYTDSATLESTIAAKYACMYEGENELYTAYDSVVVTNYLQNIKIITDTLYWNKKEHTIYNYCFTKFFLEHGSFDANNGMTALEDLSDYELRTIREGDMIFEKKSKTEQDSIAQQHQNETDTTQSAEEPLHNNTNELKTTE